MERVQRIVADAVAAGHVVLLEDEAYAVAAALGMAVPGYRVVSETAAVELPDAGRIVVKARSRLLAHKAVKGGVAVVASDGEAVAGAMAGMRSLAEDGWLLAAHVDHDRGFPGEWLLGIRRTRGFGPVVTLAPGGASAERVGAMLGAAGRLTVAAGSDCDAALEGWAPGRLLTDVDRSSVRVLLGGVIDSLGDVPEDLAEFEVNPLVFVDGVPVALDALARLGTPVPAPARRPPERIGRLLHPEGIAVAGVSAEAMNPGRVILGNILGFGFPPALVTVLKPGVEQIDGVRCVPSLTEPVDLLIVAVGADAAVDVATDAIEGRLADSIVLVAGGIGERDGTAEREEALRDAIAAARATEWGGPVVNGANSMGVRSVPGRYDALFIPPAKWSPARGRDHPVAVIAQSGAFVLSRLDRMPWLDPRYVITVGNQVDLTAGDYLAWLAEHGGLEIVALYVEGFAPDDGKSAAAAIRRIRERNGSVLVRLGGTSAAGAEAAVTHTASIAADHDVAAALLSEAGALVTSSLEEFEDLLRLLVLLGGAEPGGRRLGAVTNAGFEAVAMADALGPLRIADLTAATMGTLQGLLDRAGVAGVVAPHNPLDLTPMAGDAALAEAAEVMLADPGVDLGIVGVVPFTPALHTLEDGIGTGSVALGLAALADRTEKPWVVVVDAGERYDPMVGVIESAGVPVFRTADRAVGALGRWAGYVLGVAPQPTRHPNSR